MDAAVSALYNFDCNVQSLIQTLYVKMLKNACEVTDT